jgi:MFS family permease
MLMPFGSAFSVNNLGITLDQLPMIYMITGLFTMVSGPLAGKLSDSIGKYRIFTLGTILSIIMVLIYCNLGITPVWVIIIMNVVLFMGITSRMISSSALISGVPEPKDRGAFMGINSSVQQISGGIASAAAGMIIFQNSTGFLEHYDVLGYVASATMVMTVLLMYPIHGVLRGKVSKEVVRLQQHFKIRRYSDS